MSVKFPAPSKSKHNSEVIVRKPVFDFSNVGRYYFRESIFFTHLNSALSLIFPEGERFFIRSVKEFAGQIENKKLQQEIKDFIAQEAQHGNAHEKFNQMLTRHGYDIEPFMKFYQATAFGILEKWANRLFGPKMALSVTAAAEHYTASLAQSAFAHPYIFDDLDETMRSLFFWHAAEEIEHKHVAFDVLETVDDSYLLRIAGMLLATVLLFGYAGVGTFLLTLQDKEASPGKMVQDMFYMVTRPEGMVRTSVNALLDYFRVDFHPGDLDNLAVAREYMQQVGA